MVGYFLQGSSCVACHSTCRACSGTGPESCTACDADAQLISNKCYCKTPKHRNPNTFNCEECPSGQVWTGTSCEANCQPGTFAFDNECLPCAKSCKTCGVHAQHCTSCESDATLTNYKCPCNDSDKHHNPSTGVCEGCPGETEWNTETKTCALTCAVGTYANYPNCVACDPRCLSCANGSSCTSCRSDAQLNGVSGN
jgi:hypothetical protein